MRKNGSSVRSVERKDHRRDGSVAAVRKIKENSAQSVENPVRKELLCTSATSVDGNRKIRRIHPNSARNAEIHLMQMISSDKKEER